MTETPVATPLKDRNLDLLTGSGPSKKVQSPGRSAFFVSGETAKDTGTKRIPQIFINCEVGTKEAKKFASIPIHEIPLVKRMNQNFGGTLEVLTAGYAPGIPQVRWMTEMQAQDEYRRLAGDESADMPLPGAYILPPKTKDGAPRNVFHDVYGQGREGAERFFKGMAAIAVAWAHLAQRSQADMRPVSPEDVWAIIDLVDPRSAVSSIEMPTLPDVPELANSAPVEEDANPADFALVEHLTKHQVRDDVAKSFAGVVANLAPAEVISEPLWERVLGKAKGGKAGDPRRVRLQALLESFRTGAPAPELEV